MNSTKPQVKNVRAVFLLRRRPFWCPKVAKLIAHGKEATPGATKDGASQAGFDWTCQTGTAATSKKPQLTKVTAASGVTV